MKHDALAKEQTALEKKQEKWKEKRGHYNELLANNRRRACDAESQLRKERIDSRLLATKLKKSEDAADRMQRQVDQGKMQNEKLEALLGRLAQADKEEEEVEEEDYECKAATREATMKHIHELMELSPNGVIRPYSATHTKGLTLIRVPTVQVSSKTASSKTKQRRNRVLDKFLGVLCGQLGASNQEEVGAIIEQIAAHMRRHKGANVAHEISEEIAAKDGPLMQEVKLLYDRLRLERKVLPNTMYSWQTHAEAAQK